jgi:uncharacterized protein with PIN domain
VSRPTERPVFFIDRALGAYDVAEALRKAGAHVEVHDAHFQDDEDDTVWLPGVGAHGWIVLTKDERISRRRLEIDALMNARVGAFILTRSDLTGPQMADAFVRALPRMERFAQKRERPFVAMVSPSGTITLKRGGAKLGGIKRR